MCARVLAGLLVLLIGATAPALADDEPAAAQAAAADVAAEQSPTDTATAAEVQSAASAPAPQLLEGFVVSGKQPGPGLWRVSRGEHVLYVLGTLSPLPRRMEWESDEVRRVIADSGAVLMPPGGRLDADIGFFGRMTLLPAALSARNNPDDRRLDEVVPEALYARWQPLKQRYLGRGKGVEKRRPLLAANDLYEAALRRSGLSQENVVGKTVRRLARRARVPIVEPGIEVRVEDPRQALKDFANSDLEDIACFEQTLARVEADLDLMRERGNAWAVGDLESLRDLPEVDHRRACNDAFLGAAALRERGLDDLRERLRQAWIEAAEAALAEHDSSLALLPLNLILPADGYLAALAARGYVVQPPEPR